jgi:hypothetical protein
MPTRHQHEGDEQHEQCIGGERSRKIEMKEVVKDTRCSTTRAFETGRCLEETGWVEVG